MVRCSWAGQSSYRGLRFVYPFCTICSICSIWLAISARRLSIWRSTDRVIVRTSPNQTHAHAPYAQTYNTVMHMLIILPQILSGGNEASAVSK